MKNIHKSIIIVMLIIITSCSLFDKEKYVLDEDGVLISMSPLWKKQLSDDGSVVSGLASITKNGSALIVRQRENKDYLTWIEAESGKTLWEWTNGRLDFYIRKDNWVITDNNLTISGLYADMVQLDIKDGKELFFYSNSDGVGNGQFGQLCFIDQNYYVCRKFEDRDDGNFIGSVHRINENTKALEFFIQPKYVLIDEAYFANGQVGAIRNIKPYKNNGKNYFVITYTDFGEQMGQSNNLALYNITEEKWEYEAMDFTGPSSNNAGNSMDIYQDKVYITFENQIYCFDIMSGELIWKQNFEGFFSYSGFTISDSMMVANTSEAFTYGVNPENGQIMWKVASGGTTSPIAIMNGVAYFSGGSDGRLNAIDITTGQYIWKLKQPGPDFWKRHVAVVPGDGNRPDLIVASTYKEYMAFPAAR